MRKLLVIFLLLVSNCGGDNTPSHWSEPPPKWSLNLDPPTPLEEAQPVVGFVLQWQLADRPPADPILVEGEPSSVSIGRYISGETTTALAERVVPTQADSQPGKLVLRPHFSLALGQRYTLLGRAGVLGSVLIHPMYDLTYLSRVWPPTVSVEPTIQSIFCGEGITTDAASIELFPGELPASLEPGLDDFGHGVGSCVRIVKDGPEGGLLQPPTRADGVAFDPAPWMSGALLPESLPLSCSSPEQSFGPGCLRLEGGFGSVHTPAGTTLWVLASSLGWHHIVVEGGGEFVVPVNRGIVDEHLDALVFDLAGRSSFASIGISPQAPSPRVIINEVMSNPLGSEPAEEWVEISNLGTASATLVGWKLRDQGGEVELPPLLLEPAAFALLVRSDFVGGQAGDVPPAPGTALVRMPVLGKNGLTNAGEALVLVDATGAAVSQFPARASQQEGVSLARRVSTFIDESQKAFGPHAFPGASPGSANLVE